MEKKFGIKTVATIVITTAVGTAVASLIGGFFAFVRLSNSAVATTFANASDITEIKRQIKEECLPRSEADLRTNARDKQLEEMQRNINQRFDGVDGLLNTIIDKL